MSHEQIEITITVVICGVVIWWARDKANRLFLTGAGLVVAAESAQLTGAVHLGLGISSAGGR